MNNFLSFIQKDIISFYDNLLQYLYKFNKSESNNVVSRYYKINSLVKQIKDANCLLHNELKLLQRDIEFEFENQRKKEKWKNTQKNSLK